MGVYSLVIERISKMQIIGVEPLSYVVDLYSIIRDDLPISSA
jgi:hypothetical protein